MTISFDLDDTLIPGQKRFETEKISLLRRIAGVEPIRKDTILLFKELRSRGHQIYIYTTSFRSLASIKLLFACYGIPVDKVINQQVHNRTLKENKTKYSKYPPAFGIDLHIDDSPGLHIEGERFNFRTIIIDENDLNWVDKILDNI